MIDLSTQEKKDQAIANFKLLLETPGWKMFAQILQENIDVVKQAIMVGTGNETIEEIKILRDRLSVHEEILNTPKAMIEKLGPKIEIGLPTDDPY